MEPLTSVLFKVLIYHFANTYFFILAAALLNLNQNEWCPLCHIQIILDSLPQPIPVCKNILFFFHYKHTNQTRRSWIKLFFRFVFLINPRAASQKNGSTRKDKKHVPYLVFARTSECRGKYIMVTSAWEHNTKTFVTWNSISIQIKTINGQQ